jgi:transposase
MEATGAYWKPIYNVLERHGGFRLVVGNAQHLKAVPGRKTDVKDAVWLAQLLRHGLVRPSFIPDQEQRERRELTRYRTALIRERASEVNRLQKTLEAANIKLAAVLTDVTGVSGQAILDALVNGEEDPTTLADLAHWRVQKKREALEQSLVGQLSPTLTFVVTQQLRHLRELDALIATCDAEVERLLVPFAEVVARLDEIPGVGTRTAQVILAELGTDMTRFPTHRQVAAWAGLCPGNNASGGKRRRAKSRKGSPWLKAALTEAGWAARRC